MLILRRPRGRTVQTWHYFTGQQSTNARRAELARRANSEDLNREIGERLRELRLLADMTQQELGAAIGVSYVQIQKYESGKNRIAVSTLIVMCQALNSGPMDFIGRYF
ncbi:helix-turn-helix domain-containing protein [Phyllobacterium chamaecytisi]|uniref:helix-turn-helix domain-containing protein n=1 Tax=Phyllobacterium chamaecytisi TaxID=2876082 RepID=UPI001CC9E9CE|nr:helix-turn-helix domain-containing protein [Phyllobacterium sp. KW56]